MQIAIHAFETRLVKMPLETCRRLMACYRSHVRPADHHHVIRTLIGRWLIMPAGVGSLIGLLMI